MKPWETIEQARANDGTLLALVRRGDEWMVRCDGKPLMSTRQHGSEEALARLALEKLGKREHPRRVFLGGLGLGFTARAALERLPADATLLIAERTPALIAWNRNHLGAFANHPLRDPRAQVLCADAVAHLYQARDEYDALLLDLDNGPSAMVHASNARLYDARGVQACGAALRAGGVLAVWSAGPDDRYLRRLGQGGFAATCEPMPARGERGGTRHAIFLGVKKAGGRSR